MMLRLRRPAALLLVPLALLVGGCSASADSPRASSARPSTSDSPASVPSSTAAAAAGSPATRRCGLPAAPSRRVSVRTADGLTLPAYETGHGARGVVLVHETGGQALCGWWPYAIHLATLGYHVLLFDQRCYGRAPCPRGAAAERHVLDVAAAVASLRRAGARQVVLVGASLGGSVVLAAAAAPPPGVTAVASLSGDLLTYSMDGSSSPLTARNAAARVHLPVLLAVARADGLVSVAESRALLARMPSRSKRLVVLPAEAGHGWDMLLSATADSWSGLAMTLQTFLARHS